MQEELLHYIWKFKKFDFTNAKTTEGDELVLVSVGNHNHLSGPDFFNAKLRIAGQLWAGNVEIHIRSSDWYFHAHETDKNYDNVILHVVWEDDVAIYRKDESRIPCLELKSLVLPSVITTYNGLMLTGDKWINCEKDFPNFGDFELDNWLEYLYFDKLEDKSKVIKELLQSSKNDWEATLFKLLAKGFGLNINGEAFLNMAEKLDFAILKKLSTNLFQLEALFFGLSGLLEKQMEDPYFSKLKREYAYLSHKFNLDNASCIKPKFFRLRPDNFPSIRLAQLAAMYHRHATLFSEIINISTIKDAQKIFDIKVSDYWNAHYNFGKEHSLRKKRISNGFIELLLINTVLPIKFAYSQHLDVQSEEQLVAILKTIPLEKNSVVLKFNQLRPATAENALQSQALLKLKNEYCDKNRCLQCSLGAKLLGQTSN